MEDNAFSGMDKLEDLYLNDNKISEVRPETWTGVTSLRRLLLSNNSIKRLPEAGFQGLSRLEDLWLYGNDLREVTSEVWVGLHSLRGLFLEKNKISSLPANAFGGLDKLQELYLHNNKITEIKANIFDKDLRSLRKVQLQNNKITFIQPGTFSNKNNLNLLRLSNNRLSALPERVVGFNGGCPRDLYVTFAGNPCGGTARCAGWSGAVSPTITSAASGPQNVTIKWMKYGNERKGESFIFTITKDTSNNSVSSA